jgi:outer membrane protein insertion porin family
LKLLSAVLSAWLAACLPLSAQAPAGERPLVIASVAYDSDGPVESREVSRLLEVRAGQPFDPDAVRRSIQNLYATERFSDVRAESEPAGEGRISLTFHLFRSYRVDPLTFSGSPVSAEELRRALGFRPGGPFQQPEIAEGAERLKRLLLTEGYAEARVDPRVAFDRVRFAASVEYRITAGPATRVVPAIFDGDIAPFRREELLAVTKLKPGDRYREEKAQKDAQRLQSYLLKAGRLKAEVRLIGVDTRGQSAAPVYRIEVGPVVTFVARGVEEKKVEKDFENLLKNQVFQEDLLVDYVATLRRAYQEKGYHQARADYSIVETPERVTVTLTVARGPREWIEKFALEGSPGLPEGKVRSLCLTHAKSLFHSGRLVDDVLEDDRRAILGYYRTHGYMQAKVGEPAIAPGDRPGALRVALNLESGPQTRVGSRRLEGCAHTDPAEIEKLLETRAGEPYDPVKVEDDRVAVVNYYRDRGWTHVAVEPKVELTSDLSRAAVTQIITEGPREFFGKTIIRGNTRTRTERLRLPLRSSEGDPFSETKLLETQRELARTGVFQKVDVKPDPPEPSTGTRNVVVDVTEGRPLSLLYGVGYQYEDPTGDESPFAILGIGYNNLFGTLRSVSLETRYAPLTGRGRVFLNLRDPYFLGADIPVTATAFYSREPIQKIDVRRRGVFVEGTRQVTARTRLGVRYEFQRISVGSTDPLDIAQLQPFDRSIAESTVGATLLYDRRDDPIDPHRGVFLSTFAKDAFPVSFLSADAKYQKTYGQASAYVPVLGGVLAASVRAGVIHVSSACRESFNGCIPIAERFFSGGRTSDRGFDSNIEGIPGETVDYSIIQTSARTPGTGDCRASIDPNHVFNCDLGPRLIGGSSIAGWNAEWRFPIAGDFGGTLFYDATQIWSDGRLRFQVEGRTGLRQSVGLGLRYLTPVGPLRLEYGKVLRPQSFEVPVLREDPETHKIFDTGLTTRRKEATDRIFLSIGYPF